ncbi:hypothetical protein MRX96_003585 [Rhipicephalus microplus]
MSKVLVNMTNLEVLIDILAAAETNNQDEHGHVRILYEVVTVIWDTSWAEGESERDGSFFSIGDVVAPHGSAGMFCECVVHDCGYSLIVCMVVVGSVNIVRSVLVCISSLKGFCSGFPPALM